VPTATDPRCCSVIIPAYNVAEYLAAAIESALVQTYRPLEIVVVDDGATDATAEIAQRYADEPGVVLIHQANRGLAGARNRGVAESHGGFVALLDGDDVWKPQRVARCIAELDAHPELGWVTTDWYLLEGDAPTERRWYDDVLHMDFPAASEQLRAIALGNFCAIGSVVRRELFTRHGVFDERLRRAEDYELWIRFLLGGERAGFVDEPLGWYRLRPDSLSADNKKQWEAHLNVLERHAPTLAARGAPARSVDVYAIARRCAERGDRAGAARFAWLGARAPGTTMRRRAAMVAAAVRARAGARI
jgi:glycosyltransferase involved in cell wall biosynthesis